MPHPGLKVATNPQFDGRLSGKLNFSSSFIFGMFLAADPYHSFFPDIEPEFKARLVELMPVLLSPSKLVPKEINGRDLTAGELLEYFKVFRNFLKFHIWHSSLVK